MLPVLPHGQLVGLYYSIGEAGDQSWKDRNWGCWRVRLLLGKRAVMTREKICERVQSGFQKMIHRGYDHCWTKKTF